jgi:hypothetical protein
VQELGREEWFRADLSLHTVAGTPLASAVSTLRPRIASPDEVAKFAGYRAADGGEPIGFELVYLVELDEAE